MTIEHYNECLEYHSEFGEYAVKAYLVCLIKVTHVMTEKEFEVVIPILTKLRRSLVPQESPIEPAY